MVRLEVPRPPKSPSEKRYFNSTMVRLEVTGVSDSAVVSLFQFHYGTIRSWAGIRNASLLYNFNSTMVRLEGHLRYTVW